MQSRLQPFMRFFPLLALALTVSNEEATAADKPVPLAKPRSLGISAIKLAEIDTAVELALSQGKLPGAVVVILHRGKVIFRKAYGARSLEPDNTLMGPDIVFDLASLTKPIATAASILLLIERGKLRLDDPISKHFPGEPWKKEGITVEQCLLHTSGLIADNPLKDYKDGREKGLERIYQLKPIAEPGSKFIYSDMGYIVLGDLVERLSGMPLDQFAKKNLFDPLGMNETGFRPQGKLKERAAPTERRDGRWMIGEVHDPRAYALSGVAGHAGLFSTADDLTVFAQMILNGGDYDGRRVLKTDTIRLYTTPRKVPGGLRTPGWDVQTSYSKNRGDLFPSGKSFGHTGFTGTSLWVDPGSQTAVLFLSNRVHPDGKGNVTALRGRVATIAAEAVLKMGHGSK
jgi:CubicO group peptidase (beta-lactamase class C family)